MELAGEDEPVAILAVSEGLRRGDASRCAHVGRTIRHKLRAHRANAIDVIEGRIAIYTIEVQTSSGEHRYMSTTSILDHFISN